MPWSTGRSERSQRLPKDWHRRRAIAKRNADGRCQRVDAGSRCAEVGTDCDHVDRTLGDDPSNLEWLCRRHHALKSSAEGQAAMRTRLAQAKHRAERHPGLV